jgi:macrolide-specific efflux system membrane fusion protein
VNRGWKLFLIFIVLAIGGTTAYLLNSHSWKKHEAAYEPVNATKGTIRNTILSAGTVAPENRLDIKPPIPGRIDRILVAEGQRVKPGQIIAWMSSTERAALLDAAKAKSEAEMKYWEDAEKPTPLIAPIKGVIILKNSEQGQTVTASDSVLTMSDRLIVKALVDETDIAKVKVGQKVEIVLDAYDDTVMPGKVVHIAYDAKTVSNVTTYEVQVLPDRTPPYMKSGMTSNVTFVLEVKENALYLPTAALHRDHGKFIVNVPNPAGKGEPVEKEVETGISDGKRTEILSGITETDTILMPKVTGLARKGNRPNSPFSPMGGGRH